MKEKLFKKLKRKIDVLESISNDYQQTLLIIKTAIKIY